MDKNIIKEHLIKTFVLNEENTPGISVTKAAQDKSKAINKKAMKDVEKEVSAYDKASKKEAADTKKMPQNKFNYSDDDEKEYHDEMEILNGQEMIRYDRMNKPFQERTKEYIEGSTRMGNKGGKETGNAEESWGASSDNFGKDLVKRIKASTKKRYDAEDKFTGLGDDVETDKAQPKKVVHDPRKSHSAINEVTTLTEMEKGRFTAWCKRNGFPDGPSVGCAKKAMGDDKSADVHKEANFYMNTVQPEGKTTKDITENNTNNKNKPQIKESMKRLKFKKEFNGVGNALKLIPESYRIDKKEFEMTDGIEAYKIRWEGTLNEGRAVILTATDKNLVTEDIARMKALYKYKSEDTLGLMKGKERITENSSFADILAKTKRLLGESEDIEDEKADTGEWEEVNVPQASEAKKHIEGSTSTDKGTQAPKPKSGEWEEIKKSAPEAKKHVEGSASTDKGTVAPKPKTGEWEEIKINAGANPGEPSSTTYAPAPKTGEWDKINVPQAAEAKKHVHMHENLKRIQIGENFFAPLNEEGEEMIDDEENDSEE